MKALIQLLQNGFGRCLVGGLLLVLGLALMAFVGEPGWADPKSSGALGLWIGFLGTLHPVFLHLPIGALMLLVLMEGVSLLSLGRYRTDTSLPLAFALITSLLALVFGYALYLTGSYTGELIEQHKDQALVFTGLLLLCVLFKLAGHYYPERVRGMRVWYTLSLFGSVAVMTLAGHNGGLITHGDPMDKWPAEVLAQREAASEALRGDPVIFEHVVQPILQERCVYCHGEEKQEGSLRLDSYAALLTTGESGPSLVLGDVSRSELIQRLLLPVHDDKRMPPTDKPQATDEEIALLNWWVDQGAPESKSKSELAVSEEIDAALASLVSPAERKAREAAQREELAAERKAILAERERLQPLIDAFNANYPGALTYLSSEAPDLNFTATSYASTFGTADLEALLPFANVLVNANLSRTVIQEDAIDIIAQLTALRELNLAQMAVGNAFIAGLTALPNLELLNIFDTQVSSESDSKLLELPALRTLYIGNTRYDAAQTIALREAFAQSTEHPVEVVGIDVLPELSSFTEEGAFALSIEKKPEIYGQLLSGQATVTLSSNDLRYAPSDGIAQFTQKDATELEFAFHSTHEIKPWVQLGFNQPMRISAFVLKNRANIPQRAEGLELQRQRHNGSWETIWTASSALAQWVIDLTDLPETKRESAAFRFIINSPEQSMLHLAHLSLWGHALEAVASAPLELSESLAQTGQGDWSYVVAPQWGKVPGHDHIGATHGGIVVDQAGRVYVSTDGPHGILVYRRDGTFLKSIAKGQGPYHGLCLHTHEGQEFIYAAANTHMAKYTLNGDLVLKIEGQAQAEANQWKKGTAVAVAPAGEIFIADGYGSSVIFKYSANAAFLPLSRPGQDRSGYRHRIGTKNLGGGNQSRRQREP